MSSNIVSGTAKGVGVMAAGVGAGAVAVVALPVAGAKNGGIKGGLGGLLAGMAGLTVGVVGGSLMGVGTMVKGIIDTPGAIIAFARDDDLHGKEKISLEEVEVLEKQETDWDQRAQKAVLDEAVGDNEYVPRTDVKDRTYYELLGAEPNATSSTLKRKYYVLARKEHPDKGGDLVRFQKIGEAYSVLSDPEKRKKYDELGVDGLSNAPKGDPGIVFAMMFGEQKFHDHCGELQQVMQMRLAENAAFDTKEKQAAELGRLQKERVEQLGKKLALRLDTWIADKEKFVTEQLLEFEALVHTNLGAQMCTSIGIMYEIVADSHLGFKGRMAALGFAPMGETMQTLKTSSRMMAAMAALSKEQQEQEGKSPEEQAEGRSQMEQHMFNIMALDIETAVGAAARMALSDASVDKETRRERAQGLLKLGQIFQGKLPAPAPVEVS